MNILGIDASTKTGICVLSPLKEIMYTKVITSHYKGLKEADRIALKCQRICVKYKVDFVFLESPAWGVQNKIILDLLVQINVMIRYRLLSCAPVFLISPLSLKKFITGNGRATKKQVSIALQDHWQLWNKNGDIRDAIALSLCGYHFLKNEISPWGYSLKGKICKVV